MTVLYHGNNNIWFYPSSSVSRDLVIGPGMQSGFSSILPFMIGILHMACFIINSSHRHYILRLKSNSSLQHRQYVMKLEYKNHGLQKEILCRSLVASLLSLDRRAPQLCRPLVTEGPNIFSSTAEWDIVLITCLVVYAQTND